MSPGIEKFDDLPAVEAVAKAWADPGRNPLFHQVAVEDVRKLMPLLARALDRLAKEQKR